VATSLVTGANRGIGLELCQQLKARGDDVIAVCRARSAALDELGVRIIDGVDVSRAQGVARLKDALDRQPIDLLVNNAGILMPDNLNKLDFDNVTEQFRVNSLGPLRVTHALLGNLHPGSKVAIITSRMGSIADNGSGRSYGYRMSKAAVNMAGMSLSRDLQDRSIAVIILHPGMVATQMTAGRGIQPADSARGLLQRIDELTMDTTGTFWHAEGYPLPW
jgi:NAD(P)-dependent dehydrogenase (short-subunit alcohol dehydrogenase family)